MPSLTQLLSHYPCILRHTHKILTSFSLILSLNSTYQVCATKKCTKKYEEEIGNMSSTINSMKDCTCGAALGPGLYGGSDVKRVTFSGVMGHEREKDGESREKEELGSMGRRETTWQERAKEEGGKKSERDPADMRPIQVGDGPGPMTIKIAEASSKVSDGSEDVKTQSGDQKNGKMRKVDRSNKVSENVKSID
ncbi:uncharacterized protein EAF02_011531 [Botrytis sinoallii]|uniref:uncharacterized protein n=1 Tax=Botrytis sinoallii TaxID=1463999 RepID=UPI001900B04B|nr:uncharacterized protein EAF02_011531 [Botrytis sinoallii]KAF7855272.1 hypothetical protein EAF02_011531 [Botrytis sinoallii]